MNAEWHYAYNGYREGPSTYEAIASRIRGVLGEGHLVWKPGMSQWSDARHVAEFADLFRAAPPPLPLAASPSPVAYYTPPPAAGYASSAAYAPASIYPWRRYFARTLDNLVFALVFGVGIAVLVPGAAENAKQWEQAVGFIALVVYIPVEGFLLYAFGGTLGKALYGIKIQKRAEPIGWGGATYRSLLVWWRGQGINFPIVSLVTLTLAYKTLKAAGVTTWDRDLGWTVAHAPIGALRWVAICIVWVILIVIVVAGAAAA